MFKLLNVDNKKYFAKISIWTLLTSLLFSPKYMVIFTLDLREESDIRNTNVWKFLEEQKMQFIWTNVTPIGYSRDHHEVAVFFFKKREYLFFKVTNSLLKYEMEDANIRAKMEHVDNVQSRLWG